MSETKFDSPAHILLRSIGAVLENDMTSTSICNAWRSAFDIPANEGEIEVYRKLAVLGDHVAWTQQWLEGNDTRRKADYRKCLKSVEKLVVGQNISASVSNLHSLMPPERLEMLRSLVDRIEDSHNSTMLELVEIDGLKSNLESAFKCVRDSNLPEHLRAALLEVLEVGRQILSDYEIRGDGALEELLDRLIGRLVRLRSDIDKRQSSAGLRAYCNFIVRVSSVVNAAAAISEVVSRITGTE